jgi:hypothetical protein
MSPWRSRMSPWLFHIDTLHIWHIDEKQHHVLLDVHLYVTRMFRSLRLLGVDTLYNRCVGKELNLSCWMCTSILPGRSGASPQLLDVDALHIWHVGREIQHVLLDAHLLCHKDGIKHNPKLWVWTPCMLDITAWNCTMEMKGAHLPHTLAVEH